MSTKPTVLCIVGPTACGKTSLSIEASLALSGEVVSADAVAVYRGLDIGSAKPSLAERKGVVHHLIDCADITDSSFTVSTFRTLSRNAINDIASRGKLPVVVGGSGLYLDAVFSDMRFSAPSDPEIRASIEAEYDRNPGTVYDALSACDPVSAERLHINDRKRIVRALEVYRISGKPFSELNKSFEDAQQSDDTYHILRIGVNTDRNVLYHRIEQRVDHMMQDGLYEEACAFFKKGFTPENTRALQSIGYAQLYDVFCGQCSMEDAVAKIKLDTRHFAKRQITWFKRNQQTVWFDPFKTPLQQIINTVMELLYEQH